MSLPVISRAWRRWLVSGLTNWSRCFFYDDRWRWRTSRCHNHMSIPGCNTCRRGRCCLHIVRFTRWRLCLRWRRRSCSPWISTSANNKDNSYQWIWIWNVTSILWKRHDIDIIPQHMEPKILTGSFQTDVCWSLEFLWYLILSVIFHLMIIRYHSGLQSVSKFCG